MDGFLLDGHYYQYDLGWMIKEIINLKNQGVKIEEAIDKINSSIKTIDGEIARLNRLVDAIYNNNFEFVQHLIESAIKNVFFGLTKSGHFVAYIPESWDDIIFYTSGYDYDISGIPYGHLILRY